MANSNRFGPEAHTFNEAPVEPQGTQYPNARATSTMTALQRAISHSEFGSESEGTAVLQNFHIADESLISQIQEPPEIDLSRHDIPQGTALDQRIVLATEPDSERAASFRILRHHLLEQARPQVVVVSSARPDEGKTTTAVNLALALAECGRAKVLLVEAIVRQPQLAKIFAFTPPWCFAEQLSAHREQPLLKWSLVDIPHLWLHVAAINPELQQRQLLDAPAFAIAMERLRMAQYDHIVIDAPAVLGSAEVNLIQDAADGVVLAARAKRTTARDLRHAVEQLTPTKVIGTVLLK